MSGLRSIGANLTQCIDYWKSGAGALAIVALTLGLGALPLTFVAHIAGEVFGWSVRLENWLIFSALVFGPYWLGRHYRGHMEDARLRAKHGTE